MEEPINENLRDELLASHARITQEDHISPYSRDRPSSAEAETGGMFEVTLDEVREKIEVHKMTSLQRL